MRRLWIGSLLILLLSAGALASSVSFGDPIEAQVVEAVQAAKKPAQWQLKFKLLKHPGRVPRTNGQYKKGSVVEVEAKGVKRSFKKGDKVMIRWMNYSGMGPNGPVGGLSWQLAP